MPALEDDLVDLHNGAFGRDQLLVTAEISGCVRTDGQANLSGLIVHPTDPGKGTGNFKRIYTRSDTTTAEVYNDGITLPDALQKQGFNSDLSRNVEIGYRRLGIRWIRLTAGREVGGLVWASTFDFDDGRLGGFGNPSYQGGPSGVGQGGEGVRLPVTGKPIELRRKLVAAIADAALLDKRISAEERESVREVEGRLIGPALILRLGDEVGKRMLRGSRWPGVKDLA